jgi:hypothetical protein
MSRSRRRNALGWSIAASVIAILSGWSAAALGDGSAPPAVAHPPAAPAAAELVPIQLRLSMPAGLEAREASVWVLAKAKPILAVFNAEGEATVELPKEEADLRLLYVSVAGPWRVIDHDERNPIERQDDLSLLMIRLEQYSSYFPAEIMRRLEPIRTRPCIAALEIRAELAVRTAEVQMLRGVDLHGQIDHPGEHPRWYPRRWSMPRMSYAPRIGESGDFRYRVPEGVEISFLAWCEGCRLVEVTLPPWRRGDGGVHIRLPTTAAEDLVDGPSLGFRDARVDRRTGEFPSHIEGRDSYCRSLTFVSLDGKTMFHWGWPAIRRIDDVGAEFTPGGWKAADYFGQLGFYPHQAILYRLQIGTGTWWVFEMEAGIGSGMADFWTCLEGIRDGFDIGGFGIPQVTVTREPGSGRSFDALQIRKAMEHAAEWIRSCRAADRESRPRPAKPEAAAAPDAEAAAVGSPKARTE